MLPISVCIIAKNEEKNIERCLSSLAPYGFEIVLVDTGSTDRTKELAAKYTDKIYDFVWVDDFSAARNFSLEKASNNWIFMIDCDEWIETIDIGELEYFRKHLSHAVGSVDRHNITGTPDNPGKSIDRTERFFSRSKFHYTGTIHEQLTPKYEKTFETFLLKTSIGHDGYCMTEEARLQKSHRNVSLLLKQLEKEPDNPYVYYQLGKGYQIIDDSEKACEYFSKGLEFHLDPELAYVQAMVIEYGFELLKCGKKEDALLFENIYEDFSNSADFEYLMGVIYLENARYNDALNHFQKATTFEFANRDGANTYLAYYQLGRILGMAGEAELAIKFLRACGNYPPAVELLSKVSKS